jgi:murein DD-endopeptidase MepM/ murein hydrolase activator NlpD
MAAQVKKEKQNRWIYKLRNKYRMVIMNEETYEENFSFRLSRLNVFITMGTIAILLVFFTSLIIAFTPLRFYIPGYSDVGVRRQLVQLQQRTDSLEIDSRQKAIYYQNLEKILKGEDFDEQVVEAKIAEEDYENVEYKHSVEDSLLRAEYDAETAYSLLYNDDNEVYARTSSLNSFVFFTPLKGIITQEFNPGTQHFGIDIVAKQNEAVNATLDGTVIFSDWTVETGYVIGIQHKGNFLSVYKHNSVLLKESGSFVKAGEPVAIVGESGELTTGPHLHFELWNNGLPVNPKDYIYFSK